MPSNPLAIAILAALALPALATDFPPLPDYRIADATGEYYVVWKRRGGPEFYGEWGPTEFAIARRAVGSDPVRSVQTHYENLDRFESSRGGQLRRMLENREVAVRPGDEVLGRGTFPRPPRVVLVSSTGLGFVALDLYGDNMPDIACGRGGHAVVVVAPRGAVRHALRLGEVFNDDETAGFLFSGGSLDWLRAAWILTFRTSF